MKIAKKTKALPRAIGLLVIANLLNACSTTPVNDGDHKDPWESWNRDIHGFNKDVDDAILKPVAKGYQNTVPNPVDESITNVFSNINDIGVTINDFLQLKFLQGGMDASRFLINTTVGLVGVFDVAKELDLPKHDEDFGQTLGFWGVPSGNYMVLPFLGSSTPRETIGLIGDALFNPLTYVSFFGGFAANAATVGATAIDVTDTRSDLMQSEKIINEASVDRYDFIKNAYLQRRQYLIYDGNPPEEDTDDPLNNNIDSNLENTPSTVTNNPGNNPVLLDTPKSTTVNVIDNSTTLPKQDTQSAPAVIDNSKHLLDLSAPEEEK
jgi:phospholipid-binding lipoprotein MlaA